MSETTVKRLDAGKLAALFAASPFMRTLNLEVLKMDYEKTELSVRMPLHAGFERRVGTRAYLINIRVCDGGHFCPVLGERLQQYVDIAKEADTEMGENGPVPKGCRQKSRLPRCSSWQ